MKISHLSLMALLFVFFSFAKPVAAQDTKNVEDLLGRLGYTVTWKVGSAGADWELRDFDMRSKMVLAIKSRKKVPNGKNMYYRFSVTVEKFANEADAAKRAEHINATPPGPTSKMIGPEFALREGFRRGNLVYVIGTHVYTFVVNKSLNKLRTQLEDAIKEVE